VFDPSQWRLILILAHKNLKNPLILAVSILPASAVSKCLQVLSKY
jgi:hypothetical protein